MTKDFIIILSIALIVVVGWISIDIYTSLKKTNPPVVTEKDLRPVNPDLNQDLLKDLRRRSNQNVNQ